MAVSLPEQEELLDLAKFDFSSFRQTFELDKLKELAYQVNREIPPDQAITNIESRNRDYLIFAINARYNYADSLKELGKNLPSELTYGEPYDEAFLNYDFRAAPRLPSDENEDEEEVYFTNEYPSPIYICLSNPDRFKYFIANVLEINDGTIGQRSSRRLREIIREIKPEFPKGSMFVEKKGILENNKDFLDLLDSGYLALEDMIYIGIRAESKYPSFNQGENGTLYYTNISLSNFYDGYYMELPQFNEYYGITSMRLRREEEN
jgi:hypothetical protein